MNINGKARKDNTYDAIVVGSGISGGWAAKELCEKGLKTIVLERGRNVEHIKDYTPDEAKNVFITDGAFMTSSACQNPSLTYMAFTARACDHAVKELNRQNL